VSVINKMLRDLDRRQGANVGPDANRQAHTAIARDTLLVDADSKPSDGGRGSQLVAPLLAALAVLMVAAAAAWWYLNQNVLTPRPLAQVPVASKVAPEKPVTAALPAPTPSVAASPAVAAPAPVGTVPMPNAAASAPAPSPVVLAPTPQSDVVPAAMSLRMDSNFTGLSSPEKAVKPKPVAIARPVAAPKAVSEPARSANAVKPGATKSPVPAATAPPSSLRQSSVQEALAQAQSLWNSDSHQAAIDLLHDALATVERTSATGTGNNLALALLVRELSSMELADGRVRQTLALLTRLEPALSGVADIWAIRGNAAQRLGLHAESAMAYQTALKLRPNEPRWLLGAAVSLAAQGKTAAAAEFAEKARLGGALTPEVANYLRQLGVSLPQR
jgi:hypothetical protein